MAYNLRSRLTSEGSSVAHRSEGLSLSPVELAVPMSEQTPTTAGHGLDPSDVSLDLKHGLLGPVVIEGSPEALQTDAMPAPSLSQIDSDSAADTDEQTEMLNATMVPIPAMHLAADTAHPASSVYGAGAAGTGPPPSGLQAAPTPVTSADLSSRDPPQYRDLAASSHPITISSSSDPSEYARGVGICDENKIPVLCNGYNVVMFYDVHWDRWVGTYRNVLS